MSADYFLSLKKQIDEEYHLLSLSLSSFSDEELSETLYKRFSQQIDYLQNLFDNISEEAKNLDLDQSNPELYKLLEAKQEISDCYGQFNRQKNIFYKRFAKFRNAKEDDLIRSRMEPEPESDPEEEIPEELPEDLPEVLDLEEEPDPEAEAAAKAEERKARQKKLAAEAKKRDAQYHANRLRQDEAARLGFLAHPDQQVSEADIQHERIRQEEERQEEAARETARIQEENEALRRTQERMEQAEHFDRVQSSHIDMSREGIGLHKEASDSQEPDAVSNTASMTSIREERRQQGTDRETARIQEENEALRSMQERVEQAEHFDRGQSSHIGMSRVGIGHHKETPDLKAYDAAANTEPVASIREEQRQQEAARETERIQEENEALRNMQERIEQAEHFDRGQSSHIGMSREGIGHYKEAPDSKAYDAAANSEPVASIREERRQQEAARETPSTVQTQVHTAVHTAPTPEEQRAAEHFPYKQRSDEPSFKTVERLSEFFPNSTAPESPPQPKESRPFAPDISPTPQNEYARSAHAEDASQQSQVHPESYAASVVNPGYIPRKEDPIPERPYHQEIPASKVQQASHENTFTDRSIQTHSEDRAEGHFSKDAKDLPHSQAPSSFHVHTLGVMHESPGALKSSEVSAEIPKMQAEPDPVPTSAIPERPAQQNPPYGYESGDSKYGPHFRAPVQEQKPPAAPVQAKATVQPEPELTTPQPLKGTQPSEQGRETGAFVPYQFTPSGVAPVTGTAEASLPQTADSNAKIYSVLMSNRTEGGTEAIHVSPALENQMVFNVELARIAYEDARGTTGASAAVHNYIEQRNALAQFRSAIRKGTLVVEEPKQAAPVSAGIVKPVPETETAGNCAAVYAFTPNGTTAKTIEHGKISGSTYVFHNKGLPGKPAYTPANPMIVTNQYEEAITRKMRMATASLDAAIASGEPKAHSVNPQEVKMYTDAYLAFQKAKRDGTVVVSDKGEGQNVPDYSSWQQKRTAQKVMAAAGGAPPGGPPRGPSGGPPDDPKEPVGTTGQTLGPNLNKAKKQTVKETSANIFSRDSLLKRQSLASVYAKQLGSRFQYWASGAAFSLSREMYNIAQRGDDNALHTMDTARYYITTSAGVLLTVATAAPVKSLGQRVEKASNREFNLFGTKSLQTNKELSAVVNDGLRNVRELDAQIADLEGQLAPLKEKMQASGLDKLSQRKMEKLSAQLKELKAARADAAKVLSVNQDLKTLRNEDKMEAELHKMLDKDGALPKNAKKLQESARKINDQVKAEMERKYGDLTFTEKGKKVSILKASDKSLEAEIADMKLHGKRLKAQIKAFEAKGSALSTVERKQLLDLKAEVKKLGKDLGRLESLSRDRSKLSFWNKKLDTMIKDASRNWGRVRGSLFALQGFMLRPLQAGVESNTEGLAAVVRISSNRYVHILVKKAFHASVFVAQVGMEIAAPGSVQAIKTTASVAHAVVKANVGVASTAIKTSVRSGVQAAGHIISSAVPTGIKTGIHSVVDAGAAVKGRYNRVVNRVQQFAKNTQVWFYNTSVGQGVAALARFNKSAAEAFQAALALLKSAALKGIAVFALVFLLVGLISLGFGMTSATSGFSIIASTKTSAHGRVDLMPYTKILRNRLLRFTEAIETLIEEYEKDSDYENVMVTYYGKQINYQEILSMMAVRMEQELNQEKHSRVDAYLNYLFELSHEYATYETEYECDGCKEKKEYLFEWNSETNSYDPVYVWSDRYGTYVHDYKVVEYCDGHIDVEIVVVTRTLDYMLDNDEYTSRNDDWEGWNEENREWLQTIYDMDWSELYDGVLVTSGTGPKEIVETANESRIWNYLVSMTGSEYGAAGIMGNLYLGSGLKSVNLADRYESILGYSDAKYTSAVYNGSYTNFANDNAGYGLAQWKDPAQKERLLDFAKSNGRSIGDLDLQLTFLGQDLSYSGHLSSISNAKSVRDASDFFLSYISGGVSGDTSREERANYCYYFYNKYVLGIPAEGKLTQKQIDVITVAKNSKDYGIVPVKGYCQRWASQVYAAAGLPRDGSCCAFHSGVSFGVSGDWDKIIPGAAVYGYAGQKYGHAGIYVGNGLVYHNTGVVTITSLDGWIVTYDGFCWGWEAGTDLTAP